LDHRLTVAGCFAHPDDETWALGGAFALLVPDGVRGVVWTATRGEAGEIADGSGATRETLPAVREAEERAALAALGVDHVEFGDFVDGEVAAADQDDLTLAVAEFLAREQPDVVVTMEPGGATGHPDHMAVTRAVQAAFAAYAATPRQPEPRLYYWGTPDSAMDRIRELALAAGLELPGEDDPYGPRGTPDEQFTCWLDTSTVAETVVRALEEHRTQTGDVAFSLLEREDHWRVVFAGEAYIRVHPAPRPGDPPESSLVEAFAVDREAARG
jgi:LmbE family N-acetylglucosaminyl deacetylase